VSPGVAWIVSINISKVVLSLVVLSDSNVIEKSAFRTKGDVDSAVVLAAAVEEILVVFVVAELGLEEMDTVGDSMGPV
jgi:hypothetical protein